MAQKKLIVGNWKMNPETEKSAEKIYRSLAKMALNFKTGKIVICPPALYLGSLRKISKKISLGGQDVFWEKNGAPTGEISAEMLYSFGARYVLLGHSERRALGETDEVINKKLRASLSAGLFSILCVGEAQRDSAHQYLNFVREQVLRGLEKVSKHSLEKIIIAYEPIWAIGKEAFREATPEEFLELSIFIRKILTDRFDPEEAEKVKILYGGSVNGKNAGSFLSEGKADGLLIGRASLGPKKFQAILKTCDQLEK